MSGRVVAFLRRVTSRDWSSQELAEFYRVESALIQSGFHVQSDRGVTDEGDPWFVFCREEDDEVIVHFARIGQEYIISSSAYGASSSGTDFRTLVRDLVERNPIARLRQNTGDNVVFHPAALLVMLVATALLKSGHADAVPSKQVVTATTVLDRHSTTAQEHAPLVGFSGPAVSGEQAQHETMMLSAVALAMAVSDEANSATTSGTFTGTIPIWDDAIHLTSQGASPTLSPDDVWLNITTGTADAPPAPTHAQFVPQLSADASPASPTPSVAHSVVPSFFWAVDSFAWSPAAPPTAPQPFTPPADVASHTSMALPGAVVAQDEAQMLLATIGPQINVVYQANVPAVISAVLVNSAHEATTVADAASSTRDLTHTVLAPDFVGSHSANVTAATGPGNSASTPIITPAPVNPVLAELQAAETAVQAFEAVVHNPAVIVTANQVIIYDPFAVDNGVNALVHETWAFPDGSSISLVGLPGEMPHAHV